MDGMVEVSCGTENGYRVAAPLLHKHREEAEKMDVVGRATTYGEHAKWLPVSDDVMWLIFSKS